MPDLRYVLPMIGMGMPPSVAEKRWEMGRLNKSIAVIAAAASLVFSTTVATAQARVEPVRAASTRASTPTQQNAQLRGNIGGAPAWVVALLAALAVAGLIAAATSGGGNDQSPESP